jgi:hypothetical protein
MNWGGWRAQTTAKTNTGVPSASSGQALHFVQDDGGITDNAPILMMAFRVDSGTKTKYGDSSLRSE